MLSALITGFFLGLSLIVAIGAQNAFVLRQGILRQHIFYIALFCSISDGLLIILGVVGLPYLFNDLINENSKIIFGFAALWLFSYGVFRLKAAFKANSEIITNNIEPSSLLNALSIAAILTVIGYSVNDTIVIFDRVRENLKNLSQPLQEVIQISITQTLSRTILTVITVLIVLIPLYFLGGIEIKDFALIMILGVGLGTYSSIFYAPYLMYMLNKGKNK